MSLVYTWVQHPRVSKILNSLGKYHLLCFNNYVWTHVSELYKVLLTLLDFVFVGVEVTLWDTGSICYKWRYTNQNLVCLQVIQKDLLNWKLLIFYETDDQPIRSDEVKSYTSTEVIRKFVIIEFRDRDISLKTLNLGMRWEEHTGTRLMDWWRVRRTSRHFIVVILTVKVS